MRILSAIFAVLVFSTVAMAENKIATEESAISAEMIIRQVITYKKFLPNNPDQIADLRRAIEGSGNSTTLDSVESISCEPTLGSVSCDIAISGLLNNGKGEEPEFAFTLRVKLYQGAVKSAEIVDFAG